MILHLFYSPLNPSLSRQIYREAFIYCPVGLKCTRREGNTFFCGLSQVKCIATVPAMAGQTCSFLTKMHVATLSMRRFPFLKRLVVVNLSTDKSGAIVLVSPNMNV